jgi:hypothetical protein
VQTNSARSKTTQTATVGAETDAMCGKCKKATRHIILAMVGVKPSRVECKTCSAQHAFRSTKGNAASRTRAAAAVPTLTPEEAWTQAMRRADGVTIRYLTSGHFEVGQRVTHPTFGDGVVVALSSPTVCEVMFNTGTKKLLMGR